MLGLDKSVDRLLPSYLLTSVAYQEYRTIDKKLSIHKNIDILCRDMDDIISIQ